MIELTINLRLIAARILLFVLLFGGSNAKADLAGILGIDDTVASIDSMLELRLDQFFSEFNDSTKRLLASGANEGKLLLVQAGNQMNMTSITAAYAFRSELEKPIGELSEQAKVIVAMMHTMRLRVEAGLEQGVALTDMLLINVERIIDEANPLAENSLYIHRVSGLVVPPRETTIGHQLTLRGPEFGGASQGRTLTFEISIDGQALDLPVRSGGVNTDATLTIPRAVLDGYRHDTELRLVPLRVSVTRETRRRLNWLRGPKVDQTPPVTLDLVILPRVIGTLHARVTQPVYEWQPHPAAHYSQSRDLSEPFDFTGTVPNPNTGEQPRPGQMRWARGSVSASCDSSFNPHRKLPNGRYLPVSHQYFTSGWTSSRRCEGGSVFDLATAIPEAIGAFVGETGIVINLSRRGGYCHVPAAEIVSRSPVHNGCNSQTLSLVNYSTFGDRFTARIDGRVPAPMKARWTAFAQAEIFAEQDKVVTLSTEPISVRHGENTKIEYELANSSRVAVEYVFQSNIVPSISFVAGAPPSGFELKDSQSIGEFRKRVVFGYELNLN